MDSPTLCIDDRPQTSELGKATLESEGLLRQALVEGLHRDFVHAGSDVVEAFTYYAHREKLKIVGREKDLERINTPIKGVANEQGVQRAYDLLSRCHALTNDPGIEDRIAILGGRLAAVRSRPGTQCHLR